MMLTPLKKSELEKFFDEESLKVLRFFIKKALISQPEPLIDQDPLPIQVPKEHIEQWIVQAIGGKSVGAGSYPVDIVHGTCGIDVKMLSAKTNAKGNLTSGDSGETSLAQNFKDSGASLDSLFKEKKYDQIVDGWKCILHNKLDNVCIEQNLNQIYYFFILRAQTKIHLCATSVDLSKIDNLKVLKGTDTNVFIDGLIDSSFGNGRIYKSKKRLELRLKPKHWYENNCTLDFDLDFNPPSIDIRQLLADGTLSDHEKDLCDFLLSD
ncbi:hypothetical protein [Paraclostridium bifermentans]|uniref:hypothetical protein n=1 Tax=Paraclostridium bifermentans TaxID=1490 RepID=UPI001C7EC515|nr:hypothetical protein [Paraclostridium bifermentans]GIM33922.1 hypothetical protein PAGU1678_31910 [Paraclostridium bifermentans subsp. muricolitidis]